MMKAVRPVTPLERLRALRQRIEARGYVRLLEAHSGLSGIVAETTRVERDGEVLEYDGLWESSLTDTASKGLPDASIIGYESRLHTVDEILHVTTKPLVVDGDTGGEPAQFEYLVKHLERRGVSAVIIEDKVYPKRNSLDAEASQTLEDPAVFADKIRAGVGAKAVEDFMVIARLESLIAGTGLADALQRAEHYVAAGVDGIMIHSGKKDPADIFAFASAYEDLCRAAGRRPVLVCVPTAYNTVMDAELGRRGFNVVIHANQLLRASHKAMTEVAQLILESGRSLEANPVCTPVSTIFATVGFDAITEKDRERTEHLRPPVIIPAAGRDPVFETGPKSLVPIAGRRLLDYQIESIKRSGLTRIVVVRGHAGEQFDAPYEGAGLTFVDNPDHAITFDLHSLFRAETFMDNGFVLLYSDILFDHQLIQRLLGARRDIVLALDNSYRYHKHEVDKRLDLAVGRQRPGGGRRSLHSNDCIEIGKLGKRIAAEDADYEFIGVAAFSARGARALREAYHRCQLGEGSFHEARSFGMASITDLLQEMIDKGLAVHGVETHKGWLEIHDRDDVVTAERELVPALAGAPLAGAVGS